MVVFSVRFGFRDGPKHRHGPSTLSLGCHSASPRLGAKHLGCPVSEWRVNRSESESIGGRAFGWPRMLTDGAPLNAHVGARTAQKGIATMTSTIETTSAAPSRRNRVPRGLLLLGRRPMAPRRLSRGHLPIRLPLVRLGISAIRLLRACTSPRQSRGTRHRSRPPPRFPRGPFRARFRVTGLKRYRHFHPSPCHPATQIGQFRRVPAECLD